MQAIKMVDLQAQQKLIRKQLDLAIAGVLNSCDYILGTKVIELEQRLELTKTSELTFNKILT